MTHRTSFLPALGLGLMTLALAGCTTLGDIIRDPTLGIFGLIHLALAVYALINILASNASTGSKILWTLLVWLLPLLGLIIWFLAGPRKR
jgi:cobalamin synthase